MYVHSTATVFGILNKLDCIVEYTLDVFLNMVFQEIIFVFYPPIFEIVLTVISCAVNNVSDAKICQHIVVFGNDVRAEIQEVINYS